MFRKFTKIGWAAVAVLGLVVAAGCGDDDDDDNGTDPPMTTPSITASNQMADPPNEVVVDEVVSDGPGWAVIHEDDGTGRQAPGDVIGFASVADGTSEAVVVTLDRDAVDGETLWAMLHVDEGEIGEYEFPGPDGPVVVADEVVVEPFTVTVDIVTPEIDAGNQTLDLSTLVTVASTVSDGPGWAVIHEDDGGAPGTVLGQASVADGMSADIEVMLDRAAEDGETLWAMLHVDEGTVGIYEFPGPDVPAMDGGEIVMVPFTVTVPDGTPAVRISISAIGLTDFSFDAVEPDGYQNEVIGTAGLPDPAVTLRSGWRYEIVNTVATTHPFALLDADTPATDVVLLTQSGTGTLEADPLVDWTEDGNTIRFSVSPALEAVLDGYRCEVHVSVMRGAIAFMP